MSPLLKPFLVVISAIVLSSCIKTLTEYRKTGTLHWDSLGGMPSTHSAGVTALFFTIYFETGISLLLLICAVLSWIVMRDAYGVRWEVTQHSIALNKLSRKEKFHRTGHRKIEVAAGALLGAAVAMVGYLIR